MTQAETILAEYLTPNEAAGALRVCRRTLDRWLALREGPPVTRIGKKVMYRKTSIEKWLTRNEQVAA